MKEVEGDANARAIYALALIRQTLSQSSRPTTSPPTFPFAEHTCKGYCNLENSYCVISTCLLDKNSLVFNSMFISKA